MGQLALLLALATALALLDARDAPGGGRNVVLSALETLYLWMPVVAGILVGTTFPTRFRRVVLGWLACTLAMLALDFAPPVEARVLEPRTVLSPETGEIRLASEMVPNLYQTRALVRVVRWLSGQYQDAGQVSESYGADTPRLIVAGAIERVSLLFGPFICMGIVLGLMGWVDRRVLFRNPQDERIAYVVMAWVLAPAAYALLFWLLDGAYVRVLASDVSFLTLFLPHLILGGLAALGWRSGFRSPA